MVHYVVRELRQHARRALFGRRYVVELRAYEIEGPEKREFEPLVLPVSPYHAVEHLLYAGVYPALLGYRPEHERGFAFVKPLVGAHAVHFGGGREDYALPVLCALLYDVRVRLVVEAVYAQGVFDVEGGGGDRHKGHDGVARGYLPLDPFGVLHDVLLVEFKPLAPEAVLDFVRRQVRADDRPVRLFQDFPGQRRAYEAVDPEY